MLCDMLYLQMEGMGDAEKAEVLRDTYGRIYAIARLHEQLYRAMQSGEIHLGSYRIENAHGAAFTLAFALHAEAPREPRHD
jgi:two-component sensor histidine kinase